MELHEKMAASISSRLNNYLLRFGHCIGRAGKILCDENRRIIVEMCKDEYVFDPNSLLSSTSEQYISPNGIPDSAKSLILEMIAEHDA
jgi:hypothetical protein